ncbi:hypothetical protein AXK79_19005, partial [Salmonella enterica subsp. enterica]|nr:hypothetical protein [Salmonella enterica subsp. enterica serovar Rissen]EAB2436100.1 hypothetical protein [Salmonella enterica]EAQ7371933.1 hypothetical protein [Salmonella enterica]EBV4106034.1 hypothetical protein [Salmonella enterica subsp. enterica serovar Rissen]EBW4476670.1 hypothetical protein [Salmonella enterica subsp. enterica serovar Rissen]
MSQTINIQTVRIVIASRALDQNATSNNGFAGWDMVFGRLMWLIFHHCLDDLIGNRVHALPVNLVCKIIRLQPLITYGGTKRGDSA